MAHRLRCASVAAVGDEVGGTEKRLAQRWPIMMMSSDARVRNVGRFDELSCCIELHDPLCGAESLTYLAPVMVLCVPPGGLSCVTFPVDQGDLT